MHHESLYRKCWRKNLQYLAVLLCIWVAMSFGFGILQFDSDEQKHDET